MKKVVFAGPSLPSADRAGFPDIEFRPPAVCGDIAAAVDEGIDVIGLIDGLFGTCAAVWHKEILFALSAGAAVFGGASMGALRAAECDSFGMKGIGRIYEDYRDGRRSSDADVAVIHGPVEMEFRPMTIALVDAQETIRSLAHELGHENVERLLMAARQVHFSNRTWRSIVASSAIEREIGSLLSQNAKSVKRSDANLLLTTVQDVTQCSDSLDGWTFQNTLFFQEMVMREDSAAQRAKALAL